MHSLSRIDFARRERPVPGLTGMLALITSLLGAPLSDLATDEAEKKTLKPCSQKKAPDWRIKAASELPDDPSLPGLVVLRAASLAGAVQAMEHGARPPIELLLRGFTMGSRATLEARAGHRRVAVKAYAEDPAAEAALYAALAAAGLASHSGARVPPLLAWERDLRLLVIGWLDGPTAEQLIEDGRGERAGEMAARWLQRIASLRLKLGPPFGAPRMLQRARKWAGALESADPGLGSVAMTLLGTLARTQPKEGTPHLVHGTLYARHVLDLGDGPGVIDWQRFGQGPLELDAGMFLATVWRIGMLHEPLTRDAARAEKAFLKGIAGLVDERALAWHQAAALLRLANNAIKLVRRQGDWAERAGKLLGQGTRVAQGEERAAVGPRRTSPDRRAVPGCRGRIRQPQRSLG